MAGQPVRAGWRCRCAACAPTTVQVRARVQVGRRRSSNKRGVSVSTVERVLRSRRMRKARGTWEGLWGRRLCCTPGVSIRALPMSLWAPGTTATNMARATVGGLGVSELGAARVTVARTSLGTCGPAQQVCAASAWVAWKLGPEGTGTQKENGGTPSVAGKMSVIRCPGML